MDETLNTKEQPPETTFIKPETPAEKPKENFWVELLKFAVIAVLIVWPIRHFVAQPFIVDGASMLPTFESGQYLIVDELSYELGNPVRGDVVIFKYPKDTSKYFIKRIIGMPGETVDIKGGLVYIKTATSTEEFLWNEPYLENSRKRVDNMKVTLGSDEYFVLGDNRLSSLDSRYWGPLSKNLIIGKPFVRLLPVTKISLFPGGLTN